MRYAVYCVVSLLLAVVLFAAPIWPVTIETRGYIPSGCSRWTIYRVHFWYSDYGWIKSMPDDVYGPWHWLPSRQSWD